MSLLSLIRRRLSKRFCKKEEFSKDVIEQEKRVQNEDLIDSVEDNVEEEVIAEENEVVEDNSNEIVDRNTSYIVKYLNDKEFHDMLEVRRGRRRKFSREAQERIDGYTEALMKNPKLTGIKGLIVKEEIKKAEYDIQAEVSDEDAKEQLVGKALEDLLRNMKKEIISAQKATRKKYYNPNVKKLIKGMRIAIPKEEIYRALQDVVNSLENK